MIGKTIQQKRKEAGLTQAQLADRLGVTAPAVNRWEKDLSFPDSTLLSPLARCLKIDLNELFSFYNSLSDKERELIVSEIDTLFIKGQDTQAFAFIDEKLHQNASDGLLYYDIGKNLYSIHLFKRTSKPTIYLEKACKCFEEALTLLPEKEQDICTTLMSIYAVLGDAKQADFYRSKLQGKKMDLMQAHADMLFLLKEYSAAEVITKELAFHKLVDFSATLWFLYNVLLNENNTYLANIVQDKITALQNLFELWEGFSLISQLTSNVLTPDEKEQTALFVKLIENGSTDNQISFSPLFADIALGRSEYGENTTADYIAELINKLNAINHS